MRSAATFWLGVAVGGAVRVHGGAVGATPQDGVFADGHVRRRTRKRIPLEDLVERDGGILE